jgi:glycosyltransferase involved in cell wall biosynthesis
LGCAGRVHLAGLLEKDEVLQALADSDLLLMPSEPASENFGLSAVEALGAGLPLLASDGVAVAHQAAAARAGRVVPCSAGDFGQAVVSLLECPEELRAMGRRGRELVERDYDLPVVARQMLAQCTAIAAGHRARSPA